MNYLKEYADFLKTFLRPACPVDLVADASNGAAGPIASRVFSGASAIRFALIHGVPDGRFPAHGPNPTFAHARRDLERAVLKERADLGVVFDADADRAFFVDGRGRSVYPDDAAYLMAGGLQPPYVVDARTGLRFKSNQELSGRRAVFESKVGFVFMKELLKRKRANFGAENSGHYYFKYRFGKRVSYFDSGMRAAIEMANRVADLKAQGSSLAAWIDSLEPFHRSDELNISLSTRRHIARALRSVHDRYRGKARRASRLDGITMEFDGFWFNVRPSNTEPLLRVKLEARDADLLEKELRRLVALLAG